MEKTPKINATKLGINSRILEMMEENSIKMAKLASEMSSRKVIEALERSQENFSRISSLIPRIPKEMIEPFTKLQEDFNKTAQFLPKVSNEAIALFTKIQEDFAKTAGTIQKMQELAMSPLGKMVEMTRSIFSPDKFLIPTLKHEVLEALKKDFFTKFEEEEKILVSLGWWIFPDLPMPYMRKIIKWHNEGRDDQINEAIIEFHEKNIDIILEEWKSNSSLKERVHILIDIIEAHKKGRYTLSVPTLLPQIEWLIVEVIGIIEVLKIKGKPNYNKILRKLKNKIVKFETESFRFPLENSLYIAIESLLKVHFQWGSAKKTFGRNPVSHGFYADYNQKQYSLKLILLFHYLQKFLTVRKEPIP